MAMINCQECGKEISNQAAACPGCGAKPFKKSNNTFGIIAAVIAGVIVFSCISESGKSQSVSSSSSTASTGIAIDIPSDPHAVHTLITKSVNEVFPVTVTRRDGPSGTSFSKRRFDCVNKTFMYLGTGDTLEDMNNSKPDEAMAEVVEGSIAYYQWKFACGQ